MGIEDNEQIKAEFTGYKDGAVRLKEGGWAMLPTTAAMIDTYKSMEVRASDIWVVTQPKCGTTWTQEMVWQIANNVDTEGGKVLLSSRFPFLEFDTLMDMDAGVGFKSSLGVSLMNFMMWWESFRLSKPSSWLGYRNCVEFLKDMDERRFIKSHLPLSLLPPNLLHTAKVIYVARNPKDAMVSFYHHHKLIKAHGYVGDLPTFAKRMTKDQLMGNPFFPHLEEAWEKRGHPNMLFIFYEDMKRDLGSVIDQVCEFLDCSLTKEKKEQLIEHLDIKNFRNNPAVNAEMGHSFGFFNNTGNFIRKGAVGGWKEEFENFPDMEKQFDAWLSEQLKLC